VSISAWPFNCIEMLRRGVILLFEIHTNSILFTGPIGAFLRAVAGGPTLFPTQTRLWLFSPFLSPCPLWA
jgi:hypothetical protein